MVLTGRACHFMAAHEGKMRASAVWPRLDVVHRHVCHHSPHAVRRHMVRAMRIHSSRAFRPRELLCSTHASTGGTMRHVVS